MGPRLILSVLRRRFNAAIRRGTPDTIDLLVVRSEAGMGLESALERVAEEMNRSNPAMARVLYGLLDDLRVLPNWREAFEKLESTSEGLGRFCTMISQSRQYGTPLSQALRSIADRTPARKVLPSWKKIHKLGAKLTIPMVLFMLPAMFVILGASPFLHLMRNAGVPALSTDGAMSTVTLSNNWSYDRMMRLFGGMWLMLLALCVANKIGASLTDPWPSLLSSLCLAASTCSWRC